MSGEDRQRMDRWLFFARIVKSRSLATKLVQAGRVRLNRRKIDQAAQPVKTDDVLTVTLERRVLVYRILDTGTRRGPAAEARTLYEDLSPPAEKTADKAMEPARQAVRIAGSGRPTKKQRRELDRWREEE